MTSNSKSLGEIFKHENNFNNWISENLDELSKIFTVDFDFQQKDSTKEGLRVNILAKFTSYNDDGNKKHTVIIESQLDTSDRKHLEQLITDGEQHDAKYCIWIAADFRPGHMRTLELLNELRMEGDRYFFCGSCGNTLN